MSMSYTEYFDMFNSAQKEDCPYRAFMLDIVDSRHQEQYASENINHHNFIEYIYTLLQREEECTGKKILLKDRFNLPNLSNTITGINGNYYNPMTLGDMVTYFVYNGSITEERFVCLAIDAMRKYNINYSFHFATGVYQTNDYGRGGNYLYKGYMPQILEFLSKTNGKIVSKDTPIQIVDLEME